MTTFDEHKNLALGTVSAGSGIIDSASGTTIVAASDAEAAEFPAVPFFATVWRDQTPTRPAIEIVRATGFDGHKTFTVLRAQEGTSPQAFITQGWKFANTITVADIVAIEDALNAEEVARAAGDAALQANITAEASARVAGDVATLASAETYADGKVATEATARAAGDASTLAAGEAYTDTHVAAEAAARTAADAATLVSAETYADGKVTTEAAARAAADSTLQSHIDAEASARASGDSATLVSAEGYADAAVAAEAVLRATGDTGLQTQINTLAAGLQFKNEVRVATSTSVTVSNPGTATFDGVVLSAGDSLLLFGQSSAAENGTYVFNGSGSALTRRPDSTALKAGTVYPVTEGSHADHLAILTTDDPIVVGTTPLTFSVLAQATDIVAGAGLTRTGLTLDVGAGTGIQVNADSVQIAPLGVGTGQLADAGVTTGKLADGSVTDAKLASAKQPQMTNAAVKTGAYTANANEFVPCDSTSGVFTVKLPNAPADGTQVAVKVILSATPLNNVTVQTQGSDVFNRAGGPTTATLQILNQAQTYHYDHARAVWTVISDDAPLSQLDLRYDAAGAASSALTAAEAYSDASRRNLPYLGDPGSRISTAWPAVNTAVLHPVVLAAPALIASIAYTPTGPVGNVDVGVYRDNGDGTATLVGHTGSVAGGSGSTPTKKNIVTGTLQPGLYWLAMAWDTTTTSIVGRGSAEVVVFFQRMVAASFPLPATITLGAVTPLSGGAPFSIGILAALA